MNEWMNYCNWHRVAKGLIWYARNTEEVKDSLEVKEQKETTVDKATDTEADKLYEDVNKDSKNLYIYQTICETAELKMF